MSASLLFTSPQSCVSPACSSKSCASGNTRLARCHFGLASRLHLTLTLSCLTVFVSKATEKSRAQQPSSSTSRAQQQHDHSPAAQHEQSPAAPRAQPSSTAQPAKPTATQPSSKANGRSDGPECVQCRPGSEMWLRHGQHVDFETQAHSRAVSNCSRGFVIARSRRRGTRTTDRRPTSACPTLACLSLGPGRLCCAASVCVSGVRQCRERQASRHRLLTKESGEPCRLFGRTSSREPTACDAAHAQLLLRVARRSSCASSWQAAGTVAPFTRLDPDVRP